MSTFLKKYYLDDRKLAQRALLEFDRALNSGRMIAFTGAMTTEAFGYPGWDDLIKRVCSEAKEIIKSDPSTTPALDNEIFKRICTLIPGPLDSRVGLSLFGELLDKIDRETRKTGLEGRRAKIEAALAKILREPTPRISKLNRKQIDIPASLWRDVGIERFATINFDLELEKLLMLTTGEQQQIGQHCQPKTIFELLEKLKAGGELDGIDNRNQLVRKVDSSNRLTRILANGRTARSDIVSRERSDRLIDFAMGSDDAEQQILHLHGRCDDESSLVFSYRDYDQLYRRNDLHRQPFEYGQRIMIGGNPILFVGLGMAEAELNRVLEDFISNTPYHRTAPTFLLWNTRSWKEEKKKTGVFTRHDLDADERANFRADKLHRLGVFTIFDVDIFSMNKLLSAPSLTPTAIRQAKFGNLLKLTSNVREAARTIGRREEYVSESWRSIAKRMESMRIGTPVQVWNVEHDDKPAKRIEQLVGKFKALVLSKDCKPLPIFATASAGWGKGQIGSLLAKQVKDNNFVLHINAGFCFDTDSFLDAIARFLGEISGTKYVRRIKNKSRDQFFGSINLLSAKKGNAVCIVNGIDRFLDVQGLPLSAEFDRFIHQLIEDSQLYPAGNLTNYQIKWVFLGSDRTRLYIARLLRAWGGKTSPMEDLALVDLCEEYPKSAIPANVMPSNYLSAIRKAMGTAFVRPAQKAVIDQAEQSARNISGESRRISIERLRRAFLDAYLEPQAFAACGMNADDAGLAQEILRALAFIGLPAEPVVLARVPRIARKAAIGSGTTYSEILNRVETVVDMLVRWKLVISFKGFDGYKNKGNGNDRHVGKRYGLHRSIMAELRYRLGLPLSEAKLSTAFNMSLYVAQPVDGYIPEPEIHEELGELIDALVEAYRLPRERLSIVPNAKVVFEEWAKESLPLGYVNDKNLNDVTKKYHRRCLPENVACLRAALAVIRGYYSTTGLLTLDRTDRLIGEERDGILLEHAERLDDLIDAYGKTARLRDELRKKLAKDIFGKTYRDAEPFYPDELVWLHNERGVVRLAMGDLIEAGRSFERALEVNKHHVEHGDRSHNWRRIKLNQLTVEVERGELFTTERLAREVFEASGWPIELRVKSADEAEERFKDIIANAEKSSRGAKTHYFLQEDRLAIAIALGYRGMCANLRGEMLDAGDDLRTAAGLLRQLDEQRAFAYFTRLFAWALREANNSEEAIRQLELASDAAQSTRQMDLVYRTQIQLAQWKWEKAESNDIERREATSKISNAMDYGVKSGVHRVRTEAAATLAKVKFKTGDLEVALQYAAEAMTIATRYTLRLRMMSARVRLGTIMIERGDVKTGRALIFGAIKSANKSGFQRIVDAGQAALDRLPG